MNRHQRIALWLDALAATAMLLYPPWQRSLGDLFRDDGYALLWVGPAETSRVEEFRFSWETQPEPVPIRGSDINYPRLLTQWLLVAMVTCAAVAALSTKQAERGKRGPV